MNSKLEAKANMYHSVLDLCNSNAATVALVAAFQTSYNVFKTTVTGISTALAQVEAQTGGLAVSKNTVKKNLATLGSGIAGMVYAYASVTENETLKKAMQITATAVNRASDDEALSLCTNIHNTANDNIASLGDYGVTVALLAAFQTAVDDYADKSPKPKQSKNYKKSVRSQINSMAKDADKVLKEQMDKLIVNFMSNGNVQFAQQYHAARVIVDAGSYSTVLKIAVVNKANGQPLRGVKCYRDNSATVKRSTAKGLITYKNIEEGSHNFVLKHKLFDDLTLSGVMISHSAKTTANAEMLPS